MHGKSSVANILFHSNTVITSNNTQTPGNTETNDDIFPQCTKKSKHVSLHYKMENNENNGFLINLIDTPGHIDFSSEVKAALRISDGALVIIDCYGSVCLQTEKVLKQALGERIKPVIMINKMDLFVENLETEEIYQSLQRTIQSTNTIISTYKDDKLGEIQVFPHKGTVAFGSAKFGWCFTLDKFASMYASKFGVSKEKLLNKLWGDHFFDSQAKKWINKSINDKGNTLKRGFCQFILDPIRILSKRIINNEKVKYIKILESINISLSSDELDQSGNVLLKIVMRKFLPADECLLHLFIHHLPSPVIAQKYRFEHLYNGPLDDECAKAISNCDPNGPLMLCISMMIPTYDKRRFYTFGRIFSGTIRVGQSVRILGCDYTPGKRDDLTVKDITNIRFTVGNSLENIQDCSCGHLISLIDMDRPIVKSALITSSEDAHNFKKMNFSISPLIRVAAEVKNASDLPHLVEGLRILAKSDSSIDCYADKDTGEHIIAGVSELHLEICLIDLEEFCGIPLRLTFPFISYRETISKQSSQVILTKSPNKHTRLYMTGEPLPNGLIEDIENGKCNATDDFKLRAKFLQDEYGIDQNDGRRIWCFGPDNTGPNLLMDQTRGVQYLNEIKDSCSIAFSWVTREGILINELLRGTRFNILDATLHTNSIRRGTGQIIPTCRRCIYGAQLSAAPRLLEPVNLVEIQCDKNYVKDVYDILNRRRASIFTEEQRSDIPSFIIKAYLPVSESFGFTDDLTSQTNNQAFPQCVFDHWQMVDGDPLDPTSKVSKIVSSIRTRKGLKEELPLLENFLDRL